MKVRILLAVVLLALPALGDSRFDELKGKYVDITFVVEAKHAEELEKVGVLYVKAIKARISALMRVGDPDPILKLKEEISRFGLEKSVPEKDEVGTIESVKKLREMYRSSAKRLCVEKGKRMASITSSYVSALDKEMRVYTAAGELESAVEVKAEMVRVVALIPKAPVVEKKPVDKPKPVVKIDKEAPEELLKRKLVFKKWTSKNAGHIYKFKVNGKYECDGGWGSGTWSIEDGNVVVTVAYSHPNNQTRFVYDGTNLTQNDHGYLYQ